MGGHPAWEFFRVAYRMTKKPYLMGGSALGLGYVWALLSRTPRAVSKDFIKFHRGEQMAKLKAVLKSLLTFRRVDNFRVTQNSPMSIRSRHRD